MKRIISWLDQHLEATLGAFLLACIVAFITLQVFMRYIVGSALSWSEELTLWTFIWFIWLGISYAFKERRHVKVSFFQGFLPENVQKGVETVLDVFIIVFLLALSFQSYQLMTLPFVVTQKSVVLGLPIPLLYASAPVGSLLSVWRLSQHVIKNLKQTTHVFVEGKNA